MKLMVSDTMLASLSANIANQIGLDFPQSRWPELARGIDAIAAEYGFKQASECAQWLASARLAEDQIKKIANYLTVGETYFFRERGSFDFLKNNVLPQLINERRAAQRELIIWSAGCCTGEEAYSLAILLSEMITNLNDEKIILLATDINPIFLQKAREGVYGEWSFRGTPRWIKEKYFRQQADGRYQVLPQIKQLVNFRYLNLATAGYSPLLNNKTVDIILCRNVLLYFTPRQASAAAAKFYHTLAEGGWLLVGQSELSHTTYGAFTAVNANGAILYRKEHQPTQRREIFSYQWQTSLIQCEAALEELAPSARENSSTADAQIAATDELPVSERSSIDLYEKAVEHYRQGRYASAIEIALPLISAPDESLRALMLLTRVYADQGELDEAIKWCKQAIEKNKLDAGSHYLLAIIQQERGELEEASGALNRALYLDQNFVLAHFALGNIAWQQGKRKESKKHFRNALALLSIYRQEEVLPDSEGIMAGRLTETIQSLLSQR